MTNLEFQRRSRGLTQRELAKIAGCSDRYIAWMEHGERQPRACMIDGEPTPKSRIAAALGIPPETLFVRITPDMVTLPTSVTASP